jgi:hypothetical protein
MPIAAARTAGPQVVRADDTIVGRAAMAALAA